MGNDTVCHRKDDTHFAPQYNYGAFAGYGASIDHGPEAEAKAQAEACAAQLTREHGSPFFARKGQGSDSSPYNMGYFLVEEFPTCQSGSTFDSWFSDNEGDAKGCAQALNVLNGGGAAPQAFDAVPVRGFFGTSWQIVEISQCEE